MVQAGKRELLTAANLHTCFTPDPFLWKSFFSLVYKRHFILSLIPFSRGETLEKEREPIAPVTCSCGVRSGGCFQQGRARPSPPR